MLSNYRLGDIIIQGVNDEIINHDVLVDHPNSIGNDYILSYRVRAMHQRIELATRIELASRIVLKHTTKHCHLFPHDIAESTVVHLRLGDAVGGTLFYERRLRPLELSYYSSIIPDGTVYIIGACHFGKTSSCNDKGSTNYDECIELSQTHMKNVLELLNATHFDGGHPDIDLCLAVNAKHFVQGRGFYSKLIVEIRRCLDLKSIEIESHDWSQ